MSLRYALLGVLDARPMSGYEIVRLFDASTAWVWSAPQSQIYPALRRLEGDGLIQGRDSVRGSRLNRTIYALTPSGHQELTEWTATYHDPPATRDVFALQALYFDMVVPAEAA